METDQGRHRLDSLSLAELKSIQKEVVKAIADVSDLKKKDAMLALEAHAKELVFSLSELTGAKKTGKTSGPGGAQYRHSENSEISWSDRGRQPRRFKAALEAGKRPESMAF